MRAAPRAGSRRRTPPVIRWKCLLYREMEVSALSTATAICFPHGRLKETTTMQGPTLFYFGPQVEEFVRLCRPFSTVGVPMDKKGSA